jgi:hypothetical protein
LTLVLSQANRFLAFSRVILNHETDFFVIVPALYHVGPMPPQAGRNRMSRRQRSVFLDFHSSFNEME